MATQTIGKYQLVKKLATGGMAEVWLARQTGIEGFNRHVVIKRILPHLAEDPEFVQMFLNEAKIASRFNHPNIAQIYDLGENEGTYYIAMEFVHGEDLGRIMRKAWSTGQWVARPLAIRIVADACQALHYAHTRVDEAQRPLRVVHRDISPQNILISFDGSVKLVDFGIAKAADQVSMTKSGAIKGKFAYMAPEQAAGKPLDARTDIFALGLVLYELLSGVRPLKRDSELATLQAALECAIDPPSIVAEVPRELDEVVMRAITKAPDDRYKDARAFQMALEQFLVQQGTIATSVQVSELMETLFADRRAEEARLGAPNPSTESSTANPIAESPSFQPSYTEPPTSRPSPPARPPPLPAGPGATQDQEDPPDEQGDGDEPNIEVRDDDEETLGPDQPSSVGGFELPAGTVMPSRRYGKSDATAFARTGSRTDNRVALEEPRPSRQVKRSTGMATPAPPTSETSDDLQPTSEPAPAPPRRRTSGFNKKRSTGVVMPEAPPRRSKSVPVQRGSDGGISKYVDARGMRSRNAARLRLVAAAIAVVVIGAMIFVFKDNLASVLNVRGLDSGVPVLLTVTSNPRARVRVIPPRSVKTRELVDLGDTPLDRVSGAFVGDTIELTNPDRGIRYEEIIDFGQPNEHKLVEKVFKEATLKVRTKPPLKGATIWRGNQKIGQVGLPMKVFEGLQKLEVRADTLSAPVEFEVRLNANAVLEHEIDVAASIEKPGQHQ